MRDGDREPKCAEKGRLLQFFGARQTRQSLLTTATIVLFEDLPSYAAGSLFQRNN
jgi:hypothetical protein